MVERTPALQRHRIDALCIVLLGGALMIPATDLAACEEAPGGGWHCPSQSRTITSRSADQDGDGIPDAYDPEPTLAATSQLFTVDGDIAMAEIDFFGTADIMVQNRILTGNNVTIQPQADVLFQAGQAVYLFPGFQVAESAFFHALIDPPEVPRFVEDDAAGVIYDLDTSLMWQNANLGHSERPEAIERCEGSTHAGYSDWRLPAMAESSVFHFETNAQGIVPQQKFDFCTAEVETDGYVRTKRGSEQYGGDPGDPINFMGVANVRCVRTL